MPIDESRGEVTLVPVKNDGELFQALAIREVVFIEEQAVPEGIERDAEDARAFHILALQCGHAIGTGRMVVLPEPPPGESGKWAKLGRMAVLQAHRKGGVGSRILEALEAEAKKRNVTGLTLHAQVYALPFYEKHGYAPVGEQFEEAGMPHLVMHKRLTPA